MEGNSSFQFMYTNIKMGLVLLLNSRVVLVWLFFRNHTLSQDKQLEKQ